MEERQREEAGKRGGRAEGGRDQGRRLSLAAQWEDYPVPGLVTAATRAEESALGGTEQEQ